jgi:hypothetical protein
VKGFPASVRPDDGQRVSGTPTGSVIVREAAVWSWRNLSRRQKNILKIEQIYLN